MDEPDLWRFYRSRGLVADAVYLVTLMRASAEMVRFCEAHDAEREVWLGRWRIDAVQAVAALLRALAAASLTLALAAPALAQPDHVLLARTCVSERGWRADTNDCAAIAEVAHDRVARGVSASFEAALRALSRRLHGTPCRVSRAWLCDLDEDGHRPAGFGAASWTRSLGPGIGSRQAVWFFTLGEAMLLAAGRYLPSRAPGPVCAEPPRAWGSDDDLRRRRLAGYGWREIDCGNTANHFGVLLRRED